MAEAERPWRPEVEDAKETNLKKFEEEVANLRHQSQVETICFSNPIEKPV